MPNWVGLFFPCYRISTEILVLVVKARCMVHKGCKAFLIFVIDSTIETNTLQEIDVAHEYLDVFLMTFWVFLPIDQKVEFRIGLVLGTTSILKALYQMAPAYLAELKKQLELLGKGII